jgi:hypothetical protein
MASHQIEIDDEVLSFLKAQAEPFVDTPNSVLRRLLLHTNRPAERKIVNLSSVSSAGPATPDWGPGVPQALQQTLEVIYLVKKRHRPRKEATSDIAKKHQVDYQTVIDKYCRQLGLQAYQFDALLDRSGMTELRELLFKKYPGHSDLISNFFQQFREPPHE